MKKAIRLGAIAICLPFLAGCTIGTLMGTSAKVAGSGVYVGAKVAKTGAKLTRNAAKSVANSATGDTPPPEEVALDPAQP